MTIFCKKSAKGTFYKNPLTNGFLCVRIIKLYESTGRHVGMADEADSKSVVGNYVWVRVPPPADTGEVSKWS